ncbi:hypothetical protein ACVGVM_05980 [Pseudonocardia bannensis]|uniref:Uncharacterized protein n=1 Tax=Pseudonocardia bannensis TaxID=630973 RepID=A0A848DCE6_9PSEU|nr:hypothetical protein [Pseudonocardia bannensis]NMH90229.1 hypothetical protein [Pseudonocardia bannensis]
MVASLSTNYLAEGDAVLAHSVGFLPEGSEVDAGLVYADHYFVEALVRSDRPA